MTKKQIKKDFAKSYFSLWDLMVIIAVIGLGIGLFLPTLSKSKATSRKIQCLNNARQIVIACTSYSDKDLTNGGMPFDPVDGDLSKNGMWYKKGFRRILSDASLNLLVKTNEITDENVFVCPSEPDGNTFDYIYLYKAPMQDNNGEQLGNSTTSNLALVSDATSFEHGRRKNRKMGGNVVFMDGHGRFVEDKAVSRFITDGPYYDAGDKLTK